MKKIVIVLILILSLVGCKEANISYQTVTPEDAYERLKTEEILLLDVRTELERLEGTIESSVLFPYETIEADFEAEYPDKDQTIFVFCRSGRRSKIAADTLIELGYKDVYDLGGIIDWPYDIY